MSTVNENVSNNIENESLVAENVVHVDVENVNETTSSVGIKRARKLKSPHWEHFEIKKQTDGSNRAFCKYCNASFTCCASDGTSHLGRHVKNCAKLLWKTKKQGALSLTTNSSGGVDLVTYKYDATKCRLELAKMVIIDELPFSFCENRGFHQFCKSLRPEFQPVSRNILRSDIEKIYEKEKQTLLDVLQKCERVSLTTDLWTSNQNLGYLCLTVHYIDDKWKLHKKIIKFCMVSSPHTGVSIGNVIIKSLTEWGIDKKVSSLTCDNCTVNDVLCRVVKANLLEKNALLLGGRFFHNRCCAHILNIIVQHGLLVLHDGIASIRESVKYVKSSTSREQKFDEVMNQVGLKKKKSLTLDVSTRWNSTYFMLESAIYYKRVFLVLETWDSDYTLTPTVDDWKQAEFVCKFLKPFFNATNVLSATKTPSSNLCLHEICKIRSLMHQELQSSYLVIQEMVPQMQVKFDKYWGDCTILYAITTVLDPRFKTLFLDYTFNQIYGVEGASFVGKVIEAINIIFNEYKEQYNQNIVNQVSQESGENDAPCDEDSLEDDTYYSGYNDFLSQKGLQESKTELERYLDESVVPLNHKSFDILKWWSDHCLVYPTLSKMARDYLSIHASTVASEAAFSNGGRVLDQYRSRLTPAIVEVLICCEDWLRDEDHEQALHNFDMK